MAINFVDSIGTTASRVFPRPVIAQRDPSNAAGTKDYNYPVGQQWDNELARNIWFLSGFNLGLPVWLQLTVGGGSGVFSSLTVNPGPINLTGVTTLVGNLAQSGGTVSLVSNAAFTLNGVTTSTIALFNSVTTGSITFGTSLTTGSVTIGGAQTTGAITIGGGVQTGTLTFGGSTGVQTVNLATGGTGAKTVHIADDAAANIVTLGSQTAGALVTINTVPSTSSAGFAITNGTQTARILVGTGSPIGSITAPKGSLFLNVAGSGVADRLYVNTDAGTTWTNFVSAA